MSDIEVDPNCQSAIDTLIEAEETTRVALSRLEFRYFSQFGIEKAKDLDEIAALMRALQGDQEEVEGGEEEVVKESSKPVYISDRDLEERQAIEEQEDLFGRRRLLLEAAEAFDRIVISGIADELSILIKEAFMPCISLAYRYPWDVNDYRLLPIKPHALDKVKNPERHIPVFLRKEAVAKSPAAQRLALADHQIAYRQTLESLKDNSPQMKAVEW